MRLIATARALDDERFKWRVRAALLQAASIRKNSQIEEEVAFAEHVLRNPMRPAPMLEALTATDIGVTGTVTVDEYNMVDTEAVPDDTIFYVADYNFPWLAKQHAEGDLVNNISRMELDQVYGGSL